MLRICAGSSQDACFRLIGLSVYSQVVASLVYVEQMLFPSTPSNYSWGVQVVRDGRPRSTSQNYLLPHGLAS
jgi:hypothetical protein